MIRILVAASPIHGHVSPLHVVAQHFAARGYPVTFLTGSRFPFVAANGVEFVSLTGEADFDVAEVEARAERRALPGGPAQLSYDMRHLFTTPICQQHHALQRLLEQHQKRDGEWVVLLHDTCFLGAWPVLLGAPGLRFDAVIGLGVLPLPMTSCDTAPFGLGLPPDSSDTGRERNRYLNEQIRAVFAGAQANLQHTLQVFGTRLSAPFIFDGMVTLPDRYLQLSVQALDYPRSDAPPGLAYIGALPAPSPSTMPPHWLAGLGARPVIAVTQGTVANHDLEQLIGPTLRAMDGQEVDVVALTGRPDGCLEVTAPRNALVKDYVPFSQLLPHVDVLVTNGGYGGVQQALAAGVPLVIAGQTEDKIEVAARAAHAGVAINLDTSTPSEAQLRTAVAAVLAEPAYRAAAVRIGATYTRHDPLAAIEQAIQSIAGIKHAA